MKTISKNALSSKPNRHVQSSTCCVIISVFNESQTIYKLVRSIREKNLDVLVVDDGSTDNSALLARQAGATVISTGCSMTGQGTAIRNGFEYVLQYDYQSVLLMDGDGQHVVEDIELFSQTARIGKSDVIVGNRLHSSHQMPWLRYMTNRVMSGMISWVCNQSMTDTQCGFRYLSRRVIEDITFSSNKYEIMSELLIKAQRHHFKIEFIPIQTVYGKEISYIRPWKDTFRFIKFFIKEVFYL